MLVRLAPSAALSHVVEAFWSFDGEAEAPRRSTLERALPTGRTNLVIRTSGPPVRVLEGVDDRVGRVFGHSVVSGVRTSFYVRDTSAASSSVGVQFTPAGASAVLGAPANELEGRHFSLADVVGGRAHEAVDRVLEGRSRTKRLAALQSVVLEWARGLAPPHAAVAYAVRRFDAVHGSGSIADVCHEAGLSHRRFVQLFVRAVGVTPKVYCRIRRFQRAVRCAARATDPGWVRIATTCGFYDQAHLNREFRAFAGITPGAYVSRSADRPNHVPVRLELRPGSDSSKTA
jgi:AraC-like DNA-binding protein